MVIILSRFPFPLEKGDKLRAYHQIVGLSRHFEITLICLTDKKISDSNRQALKPYCEKIYVFKLNKLIQLVNLTFATLTDTPFQIAYFWQYHIQRKISIILNETNPNFIYSQLIRTTEYVKNYHACPKILDYMDAFSKGIERRIPDQPFFAKPFFKQEFFRLKNYERKIFEYFEEHIIISEQDRNYIFHNRADEIAIIKNGISEHLLENKLFVEKKFDLIFTGNMSYPPNVAASIYIAKRILPLLDKKVNFLVSGVNPNKSVLKLKSSKIAITGWVENISESYLQSKIFIAPMFLGTGLQNKLLEAMALGIPCITTTMANTALGAKPEEAILIADNEYEFKTQIERLLNDDFLYKKISENALLFVKTNFSWEKLNEQLTHLIVNSRNKMLV
jgi:glycosyltransferase involved in cell wall biosynthesis